MMTNKLSVSRSNVIRYHNNFNAPNAHNLYCIQTTICIKQFNLFLFIFFFLRCCIRYMALRCSVFCALFLHCFAVEILRKIKMTGRCFCKFMRHRGPDQVIRTSNDSHTRNGRKIPSQCFDIDSFLCVFCLCHVQ